MSRSFLRLIRYCDSATPKQRIPSAGYRQPENIPHIIIPILRNIWNSPRRRLCVLSPKSILLTHGDIQEPIKVGILFVDLGHGPGQQRQLTGDQEVHRLLWGNPHFLVSLIRKLAERDVSRNVELPTWVRWRPQDNWDEVWMCGEDRLRHLQTLRFCVHCLECFVGLRLVLKCACL